MDSSLNADEATVSLDAQYDTFLRRVEFGSNTEKIEISRQRSGPIDGSPGIPGSEKKHTVNILCPQLVNKAT